MAMNRVCVDAGHGGKDSGAVNGTIYEKDIALDIALRFGGLLKGRGYEVMFTRRDDTFVSLDDRVSIANGSDADIFISIHTNSALNKEANGTETLAFDKDERLGVVLHKYMIKDLGLKDRGVKQRKDLAVLNGTKMPAVLVETAFLSNESEKSLLMEAAKREMIAEALLKGVEEYFTGSEKSLEDMKKDVRERFGFDDNTMLYLEMYRYGDELIKRLSEK
ncbi:MAG: N-acetylmuramoyl-L-alanine amidase [Lachnospiraceae bacterium]|nr:N-acetylmuramoyl-L-alanine amidase [Lachnospiraceae bacterium]